LEPRTMDDQELMAAISIDHVLFPQ
jgi:hypothetical protein